MHAFRKWDADICHGLFGPKWQTVPASDRPYILVFFEGGSDPQTLYANLLVHVPPSIVDEYWATASPMGRSRRQPPDWEWRLHLSFIGRDYAEILRAISYVNKKVSAPQHLPDWELIP